jgi:hypothetical protein
MEITPAQVEYLRKCHPLIGIPMYGGICHESVFSSMIKFALYCQQLGMPFSLETLINESLITRGRNSICAKFLENSATTHLMFIDSDIGFEPEHIFKLLLHDKDIIVGLYPKKNLPIDYVVNVTPESVNELGHIIIDSNGLIEVSRAGTGFMLIKREVFNKHMAAYPQFKFTNNINLDTKYDSFMYTFFDCVISEDEQREYLSEDWYFCAKSRALGIKIYADASIRLNHSGTYVFPGDPTNFYKSMGLTLETNPQLNPKIASRKGESIDSIVKTAKPDFEALAAYEKNKMSNVSLKEKFSNLKLINTL